MARPDAEWLDEFKQMYDRLDIAVMISDPNGIILYCNNAYVSVCKYDSIGLTPNKIAGMNIKELLKKGCLEENQSTILMCINQRKAISRIFGAVIYKVVLSEATPVFDDNGKIKFIFGIVRDESEIFRLSKTSEQVRKMYAEYLSKNEEKLGKRPVMVSRAMQRVADQCLIVSRSDISILVMGESGVGKDVVSQFIHENSRRRKKPFLAINCGAIPENLIESELFGYAPGAFTGASKNGKMGIFEAANKGTVMLDEIGDLSPHMQVKLLRVLENHQVTRIGSVTPIDVDFRLISATNKNLPEKVKNGEFREDLYYRIKSFKIIIPPLRERIDDISALVTHYLSFYNLKYKLNKHISAEAMNELMYYKWPGNIRELRNVVEQLVILSTSENITAEFVNSIISEDDEGSEDMPVVVKRLIPLKEAVRLAETQVLEMAKQTECSSYKAAKLLKVDQTTVLRKMKKYNIKGFEQD